MTHNVIGLEVTDNLIKVGDLINWIEERDAACADYLVTALEKYLETGKNVETDRLF